jgi:hypothetical protein
MATHFFLGALLAAQAEPRILATLEGKEFAEWGIIGEIIERPAGISDERFAQQLVDAEGLRPWNGQQMDFPPSENGPAVKAVFAGDGREIVVHYVPSDTGRSGRVCRRRSGGVPMNDAQWQSVRWCAAAFGYALPETRPSPIATVTTPPPANGER